MHETGQLVACQPPFITLRQPYSYGWGKDDNKTTSGIDNIVLTMRWTISQEHDWLMGSLAWNIFWGIFQFQKLTFSAEAVLETSWALQSVDLPGENQIKIILCCPFKNMKPCAFSFLENTGDAARGTPEVQNQPGEVFQSRCIWISTQQVTLTYHLELYFPFSCTYLYFFFTGDLPPSAEVKPWGGPNQLPHVWPCRRDLGEKFFSYFDKDDLRAFCCLENTLLEFVDDLNIFSARLMHLFCQMVILSGFDYDQNWEQLIGLWLNCVAGGDQVPCQAQDPSCWNFDRHSAQDQEMRSLSKVKRWCSHSPFDWSPSAK